jgi:hypothetical protein
MARQVLHIEYLHLSLADYVLWLFNWRYPVFAVR